jgi:hypothetical protein
MSSLKHCKNQQATSPSTLYVSLSQKSVRVFQSLTTCFPKMDTPLFSRQISVFGALPHKNYVNNVKKNLEVSLILRSNDLAYWGSTSKMSSAIHLCNEGPSWLWSHGSWIDDYICNQCISPLTLWVRISLIMW